LNSYEEPPTASLVQSPSTRRRRTNGTESEGKGNDA
jgi:hypothetical protein